MKKRFIYGLTYTVFVAAISAGITTAWFHNFILNQSGTDSEQQVLTSLSAEKLMGSPVHDGDDLIEIFSYGCHYCAVNENNVEELERNLPAGQKLIRLHLSLDGQGGLARYAPLFATLKVMGIEEAHRPEAYNTIIKNNIDLGDPVKRDQWLKENSINVEEYHKVSRSAEVAELIDYMTRVTQYYEINATPMFIVNRKWLAIQDSDFPTFSKKLITILQTGKAPE